MSIKLGVPAESAHGERRVSIDPSVIAKFEKLDIQLLIESEAGAKAFFANEQYQLASESVSIVDRATLLKDADIISCVNMPDNDFIADMKDDSVLIGTLLGYKHPEAMATLNSKKITSYAMELIPRISRAQSMDVLSSQAAIAGYKAAIMGADLAPRFFPMLTTAAGTIRPSKVIIIGAGVAGLQAIATAKRLGAVVEAYDLRPETKEQIESLGAKAITLGISGAGEGGYARELSAEEKSQQQEELVSYLVQADVLITTAAIPGRPAPKIIPESTVEAMKTGAVIIDLAAESGGNCALTQPGETIAQYDVTIHAPLNVASQVPVHASEMYAKNIFNFMSPMIKEGLYQPDFDDEVISGALLTHQGETQHQPTLALLNKD